MYLLKEALQALIEQDVCVSVNDRILADKTTAKNLEIRDDARFMLDYIWDEEGCLLRLNYDILDSEP